MYVQRQHNSKADSAGAIRMGAVLAKTLAVLTAAYRAGDALTVGDIERRIDVPTRGVRPAVARLGRAFVPDVRAPEVRDSPILELSHRNGQTWIDAHGQEQPVTFVRLTESGYAWAIEAVESFPQGTRATKRVLGRVKSLAY